jgi:hypothetical protein
MEGAHCVQLRWKDAATLESYGGYAYSDCGDLPDLLQTDRLFK